MDNPNGLFSSNGAFKKKPTNPRPSTVKFVENSNDVIPEVNENELENFKQKTAENKMKEMEEIHYRNFAHMKLTLTLKPNLERPQSSSNKLINSFGNKRPSEHPFSNLPRSNSLMEMRSDRLIRNKSAESQLSRSKSLSRVKYSNCAKFENMIEEKKRPKSVRLNRAKSANNRCKTSQKDNLSLLNHPFRYHIPSFDHLKNIPKHSCKPNYDPSKKYVFKAKPAPSKKSKISLEIATSCKKTENKDDKDDNETKSSIFQRSKSTRSQKIQTDDPKKINQEILTDKLREQEKVYKDKKLNRLLLDHQKSFESFSKQLDSFNQLKKTESKDNENSGCFKRFLRRITGQTVSSAPDKITPVNVNGRKVVQTEFKGLVDTHENNYRMFLQLLEKTKKDENSSMTSSDENLNSLKLLVQKKKLINDYTRDCVKIQFKNPPLRSASRISSKTVNSKFSNAYSDSSANSRENTTRILMKNTSNSASHSPSLKSPSPTKLNSSSRLSAINRENQSSLSGYTSNFSN